MTTQPDSGEDLQHRREEKAYQEYAKARDDAEQDVSIETPFAKLRARGVRTSDIIGLTTLALVAVVLYFVLRAHDSAAEARIVTLQRYTELGQIMRTQVKSQRLMTCILATPQNARQGEYMQANSFCRTMAETQ